MSRLSGTRGGGITTARRVTATVVTALVVVLLTGCGPTATVPDVVGMRLDAAHRKLEALGIEKFDDHDIIEDRGIWLDRDWVVLKQSPAGGSREVDTDTTIDLAVGKVSDSEIAQMLPANAPVRVELRQQAAAAAAEQRQEEADARKRAKEQAAADAAQHRKEAAERRGEARRFAQHVDSLARGFAKVLALYDINARHVRRYGGSVTAANNALAAQEFFSTASTNAALLQPPDSLDLGHVNTDLSMAAAQLQIACGELLDAIDSGAPSSFAKAERDRDQGRDQWAAAIRKIYQAAHRDPILPPA